jgi:hypothetical protein
VSAPVVKLPTAAARKVQNCRHVPSRWAAIKLREAQPVKFDRRAPSIREAEQIAKAISPMTPERWLLLAMLHAMPADQFDKLAAFGAHGHAAVRGLMQLAKGNTGLNLDVMNALGRLDQ